MPPVLLLDTFSLFFRSFHALPPMNTRDGQPTSALYGFSSLLLKLLREHAGCELCFAVDVGRTFRHEAFPGYKGQRESAPPDLVAQLARLTPLLDALGAPVLRAPGFEADDILATVAGELRQLGRDALVVSGDRDLLQLAHGSVRVLFVGRRGKDALLYDEAAVEARFGVPAVQLPSYVALVGDPSDNLPGVPGVGPGTATRLVREHGDAATLLERLDTVRPEKLREALAGSAETILLNERLARLRADVPLPPAPHWAPPAPAGLRPIFAALEFKSLTARLDKLIG